MRYRVLDLINFMKNYMTKVIKSCLSLTSLWVCFAHLVSAESKTPELLAEYFKKGELISGEIGVVLPPEEINKYIAKVQVAAQADPEWYKEYVTSAKVGIPLPWHEKLGLTKEEYEEYLKLWGERDFQAASKVILKLEESKPGEWIIRVSGAGIAISLLRFNEETGNFKSPNGELQRIADIDAAADTILGAWKGKEWKYHQKTDFISTKENFAIGKYKDKNKGLIVYRFQETSSGQRLADKSAVILFTPSKK